MAKDKASELESEKTTTSKNTDRAIDSEAQDDKLWDSFKKL
jgi:hypothetical protein